jgi:pimeloyl-ACP methyl ester carboxylesterase
MVPADNTAIEKEYMILLKDYWENKMIRTMVKVNNLNLFYRDTGTDKPLMICLHGKWGRGETWSDLIERYQDRYRIIAPDQRGHGLSDKPVARYASEDFSSDLYELMVRLKCKPAIVVGHSMGGRVAGYFGSLYPEMVRAVVILDISAEGPENLSRKPPDQVGNDDELTSEWPRPYSSYDAALRDMKRHFPRESNVRYFMDSLVETVDGYDFLFSRQAMAAVAEYRQKWYNHLSNIQCPVLLVRASESVDLPEKDVEKMKGCIKNCTYFEVSNSDHMVYADNPEEFYPQFDQFLKEVENM